jgi:Tol biopolymer transport system component
MAVDAIGRLSYPLDRDGAGVHLVLFDPRNGTVTDLTSDTLFAEHGATFSPDGRRIVFDRIPRYQPNDSAGLWLIDIETSTLSRLTIDGSDPRWLP